MRKKEDSGGTSPGQGVHRKENEVSWHHVDQRRDLALQLGRETRRLPPHQPPQDGDRARRPEPRRQELDGHGGGRWPEVEKKAGGTGEQEPKETSAKWQENGSVDPYAGFHPLFILPGKQQPIGCGTWCPHHAGR
jgi:hypothetical protein